MIKKSLSVLASYLPSKRNLSDLSIVIIKSGCPGGRERGREVGRKGRGK